jgi:hypothetical protein
MEKKKNGPSISAHLAGSRWSGVSASDMGAGRVNAIQQGYLEDVQLEHVVVTPHREAGT